MKYRMIYSVWESWGEGDIDEGYRERVLIPRTFNASSDEEARKKAESFINKMMKEIRDDYEPSVVSYEKLLKIIRKKTKNSLEEVIELPISLDLMGEKAKPK